MFNKSIQIVLRQHFLYIGSFWTNLIIYFHSKNQFLGFLILGLDQEIQGGTRSRYSSFKVGTRSRNTRLGLDPEIQSWDWIQIYKVGTGSRNTRLGLNPEIQGWDWIQIYKVGTGSRNTRGFRKDSTFPEGWNTY